MAKNALCIGINNYPGTDNELAGCVNDAKDWKDVLENHEFSVQLLLDERATKDAMNRNMQRLIQEARSGDTVIITYSGHGSWIPDQDEDEPDKRDEVLLPYDFKQSGPIIDDYLFGLFQSLKDGVHALFISDACHSGSVDRRVRSATSQRIRYLPPESFLSSSELVRAKELDLNKSKRDRPPRKSKVLLFSGAADDEYGYDTEFSGRPNGAFTYFAIKTLKALTSNATYAEWHQRIREYLPDARWPQSPGLSGSKTQKYWSVLGSTQKPAKFAVTDLEERLTRAQPYDRLDFSDVDSTALQSAVESLVEQKQKAKQVAPRDAFMGDEDWGQHIHSNVQYWGPKIFGNQAGLATIEFDHVAVQAYGSAITFPHLVAVGVPVPVAVIVAGVAWLLKDLDQGNGIIMYVQLPSLVHWWVPR